MEIELILLSGWFRAYVKYRQKGSVILHEMNDRSNDWTRRTYIKMSK